MTRAFTSRSRRASIAGAALLLAACTGAASTDEGAAPPTRTDSAAAAAAPSVQAGAVIDSIIPIEEALRRFRAGLGDAPVALSSGSETRDALVERLARAVAARDTAALRELSLSAREFAYLYYPESPLARKPYEEPPALLWFRMREGSDRGLTRLLRRYGGQPFRVAGYACEAAPKREGRNALWERCRVTHVRAAGDTVTERLFGSILERGGRFTLVGYANDF
ncbi:MAG: hypothetical protein ACXW0Z_12710 [Gemmatirosa sp.]